jgi:catechol 2,3-dioxygenase-like lactoylglutathione lyase family enzyme
VLHHIARNVPSAQIALCVEFYGLLGFEPVVPPSAVDKRATWLQSRDGAQIHLLEDDTGAPERGHFALIQPDYDRTLERLRDAGHAPDPRREHFGAPRCHVRDPAGNLVELMAATPDISA